MPTVERQQRTTRLIRSAGLALLAALATGSLGVASADSGTVPTAPCYNGITPFNPYVDNCAIPSRPPHILGAAPDQTAILNCNFGSGAWRAVCLSQYVNGGNYGLYPGFGIGNGR